MANSFRALCLLFLFIGLANAHVNIFNPFNPFTWRFRTGARTNAGPIGNFNPFGQHENKPITETNPSEQTAPIQINDPLKEQDLPADSKVAPNDFETVYKGAWELVSANAGISAMHLIVLPNNKAVMFDSTVLGPSQLQLPKGNCRQLKDTVDCWAHSAEYDITTTAVRPLKVETDTWCSSGGLNVDGTLIQAGGWGDGGHAVRYLETCDTCDWKEYPKTLSDIRWYSTQQILPDGSFIVVGGRNMPNYEFIPAAGQNNHKAYALPLLVETTDNIPGSENNLYPHVHLSTDGNLFIFANYRSILFNPKTGKTIRKFPDLPGGARNYPGTGASAVLPIKLDTRKKGKHIPVEVVICGGAPKEAYKTAEAKLPLLPALQTCGRIKITDTNAKWKIETMPAPRVMADMLILPTGDLLMINGAKTGCSGWEFAENPYFSPVLYRPTKSKDQRFKELEPSTIPRMYHSTAGVLPEGKILVAGSSTNNGYKYSGVKYPTELRVEKFSPPYLDPLLAAYTPRIENNFKGKTLKYGNAFQLNVAVNGVGEVKNTDLKVHIYSPPFTTHGYSMNQRLLVLAKGAVSKARNGSFRVQVTTPENGAIAPPGYYMLFAVYRGLPSKAVWVKLTK